MTQLVIAARRNPELVLVPLATLLVHLVTWHGFGWFRDEFYYVVCARHLAWGYVDQPPLSIAILRLVTAIFGESLHAMRTVSATASAVSVLLTGLIARELGGGRFARALAMTAALAAPQALSVGFFYSMNVLDLVAWPAAVLALLVALRTDRTSAWAWLGVALGLGLLNKVSVLWLGGGIAVALLVTPFRRVIARRGVWVAAALAGLLFLPHVVWQLHHGWPTLEFMRNASGDKMARRSAWAFTAALVRDEGVVVALLGLSGVAMAFARWMDVRARVLAWIWIAVFAILAGNGTSRTAYMTASWTWTFALAAVALEHVLPARRVAWRASLMTVVVLFGVVAMPMALPILPADAFVRYAAALGQRPSTEEMKVVARLPQFFADMNGWESIVTTLGDAWRALPAVEQPRAVIFGSNYGEAGAVDVLGTPRGLPPAFSGHNNYFYWGPPADDIDAVVVMTDDPSGLQQLFEHVTREGETNCGDCMPYENHRAVYVGWGRRVSWASIWPGLKHFQ